MASTSKSKPSKFNTNCSVFGCHSRKMVDRSIHFHSFPDENSGIRVKIRNEFDEEEEMDKREAWIKVLHMGKPVSKYMKVCSKHFKEYDYLARGAKLHKPKLKRFAVPSQNLPIVYTLPSTKRKKEKDEENLTVVSDAALHQSEVEYETPLTKRKKGKSEKKIVALSDVGFCENVRFEVIQDDSTDDENDDIQSMLGLSNNPSMFVDEAVQVTSSDGVVNFVSTIKQESHLNSLTGLNSFEMLESLTKLITNIYPDKKTNKLCVKDRIVMVLMKLKMALKFNVLSIVFKISRSLCKKTFVIYIGYLANVLKPCIYWPSYEQCQQNMPLCFKNLKNVRIVLDCLVIPIEKPKCLCCRVRTYSHHMRKQTIKVMTGVSPTGLITFVSRAYGGGTSGKDILSQSNLMKKLQAKRDAIMMNKGFLIDQICIENVVKTIRPNLSGQKKQVTESESQTSVSSTKGKIHIESVNPRIRMFSILNNTLPNTLIPLIDNIMVTICGIVNLQKSVLADDKV